MAIADRQLRALLRSGSARVFDLQGITRTLQKRPGLPPPKPFFKNRNANRLLILKYTPSAAERQALRSERAVQTKLYLPFNDQNIEEGGKTILLTDLKLEQALEEQLALSPQHDAAAFRHDRALLDILDGLPSLDPFLMRDKFEIEQQDVDNAYFMFPEDELEKIKSFVRDKMAKVAAFAAEPPAKPGIPLPPGSKAETPGKENAVERLTQKLWEANDASALAPVIRAFRINPATAPEIVYSWKGTIYYDHEYSRQRTAWQGMLEWLTHEARPREGAVGQAAKDLGELRVATREVVLKHWLRATEKLNRYRQCFDDLFLHKKDAAPFVDFLRGSKETFWDLGDSLSRLSHSHAVWERDTGRFPLRRLPAAQLADLLDTLYQVNAG
ncbi:MAG: hypothetical protein KA106_04320 [Ferrovibrio sp.]|nr:hypothetical protein [Ferrovibrio sp.]